MKIVVDIPDGYIADGCFLNNIQNGSIACGQILKAVKNGTPYEKRPQGEWIRQGKGDDCRCSECGCSAMYFSQLDEDEQEVFGTLTTDWCPWCGADMRKETKNEDS